MDNEIKKLEEMTSFLQKELSQISDEMFNQQKEIHRLKSEITILKKRIIELEEGRNTAIEKDYQKPPHY
jgi:SlyX protein